MALQRKTPLRSDSPSKSKKGLSGGGSLKRTPLQRKTPLPQGNSPAAGDSLKPGTPLKRTPMKRAAPMRKAVDMDEVRAKQAQAREKRAAGPVKPRSRPPMSAQERTCREVVSTRSGGICERCGRGAPGLEKAHRVGRGQGGKWVPSNILDLCHDCHHHDHSEPAEAYAAGLHLRSFQTPQDEPVLWRKDGTVGWALLRDDGSWSWVDVPSNA